MEYSVYTVMGIPCATTTRPRSKSVFHHLSLLKKRKCLHLS